MCVWVCCTRKDNSIVSPAAGKIRVWGEGPPPRMNNATPTVVYNCQSLPLNASLTVADFNGDSNLFNSS